MDDVFEDKRFSHVASNPRFRKMPQKERKVKIDKRFQSMFTDKRFQVKYQVDERGRKVNEAQTDNYKKYYDLTESSNESDSDSVQENENSLSKFQAGTIDEDKNIVSENDSSAKKQNDNISNSWKISEVGVDEAQNPENSLSNQDPGVEKNELKEKLKAAHREVNKYIDEIHKVKLSEKVKERLTDITIDYARGIGSLMSDSESSSDEPSSEESDVETIEHPWGELDRDAETTEEVSRRLAVCNMDWDRVSAKDLMVLLHSFLPPGGIIESVTVYPSEFGLARLAEEELKGPKELVESKSFKESSDEDIEEDSEYQREKLREYQLKRLKYYYAIVVCNSEEAANTLYTECDGLEYESSATKLDLRFVADDVTFDQKPHDICTTLPDLKKYKPRLFINSALQQGKVNLTWDETDPNRIDFTRKVIAGEEVDEDEVQAYLASSSSEDEVNKKEKSESESEGDDEKSEQKRILKYRALISNLQDTSDKKKGDLEMEVTWGPDSHSKDLADTKDKENYSLIASASDEDSDNLISDTETKKTSKKVNKKKQKRVNKEENYQEDESENAELELLLADDDPEESGRHHFNLKAIQKEEKESRKKKKWRKNLKKKNYVEEDTFKIDIKDDRFSALFTSHLFNIDPADPHFRKTKAMNELITEKLKRRKLEEP